MYCTRVWVYTCHGTYMAVGGRCSFHHLGPWDQTQVVSLYLLVHLASLHYCLISRLLMQNACLLLLPLPTPRVPHANNTAPLLHELDRNADFQALPQQLQLESCRSQDATTDAAAAYRGPEGSLSRCLPGFPDEDQRAMEVHRLFQPLQESMSNPCGAWTSVPAAGH